MSSSSTSTPSITTSTSASGTKRVSGLYSNMDVDGMVAASLTKEQARIDSVSKDLQYAQWQKEAYEEVNSQVKDFYDKYLTYSSPDSILTNTKLDAKSIELSENTSAFSVSASASATVENFSVLECSAASYARVTSGNLEILRGDLGTREITVEEDELDEDGNVKLDEDGNAIKKTVTKEEKVTEGNITLQELATKMYGDGFVLGEDGYITLNVATDKTGESGVDIKISTSGTLSDMMDAISNATYTDVDGNTQKLDLKVSYNGLTNKFDIQSDQTGADQFVKISGSDGLIAGAGGIFGESASAQGTDASITVRDSDGDERTITNATNAISVAGFTFDIKGEMARSDSGVNVTMKNDVDAMAEKITNFVNAYNELVTKLSSMYNEKRSYTYKPLTDAEKEKLSDKQIEELENKAKQGILGGNTQIRNLLTNLRSTVSGIKTANGLTMRDIGIGTGNYFSTKVQGTLEIDQDKLKSALNENSGEVLNLFTQAGNSSAGIKDGLAKTFQDLTKSFVDKGKNNTISSFTKKISSYESNLERLKDLFAQKEDKLYSKFAQLETLLLQMDASSSMFFMQ